MHRPRHSVSANVQPTEHSYSPAQPFYESPRLKPLADPVELTPHLRSAPVNYKTAISKCEATQLQSQLGTNAPVALHRCIPSIPPCKACRRSPQKPMPYPSRPESPPESLTPPEQGTQTRRTPPSVRQGVSSRPTTLTRKSPYRNVKPLGRP